MFFFTILFICSLKFNFESIAIPSSVTDDADFIVMLPIFNVFEHMFPRIIIRVILERAIILSKILVISLIFPPKILILNKLELSASHQIH